MKLTPLTLSLMRKATDAYSVPIPGEYMTAVGAVIVQWGYFESLFSGCTTILLRHPDCQRFGEKIPNSFKRRSEDFAAMCGIAFKETPSLVEKTSDFASEAYTICKKRNLIAHGIWFDHGRFNPDEGVVLSKRADGNGEHYSVTLDQIERIASEIGYYRHLAMCLFFNPAGRNNEHLTPSELSALQLFHKSYPERPQEAANHHVPKHATLQQRLRPLKT